MDTAAQLLSHVRLYDPTNCGPPSSSIHETFQARILEWVAMPSSRGSAQLRDRIQSPALQVDSLLTEPPGKPVKYRIERKTRAFLSLLEA